ncbi:probable dehydrogenase [Castellaniella defragrans 65Phen]|uniref:Probable dehydrogenase n=1 Tax=Castellaniella defragrans (strain DSM 12143 / CCUG 39792 / 65Phen) TaxID=1437824 RepID=W8WVK3_CASD6|nr:MaoC/PaaZ C-terminal domain-containing protein [Castellaniella defragrans]CDM23594.1 probable dehydrogenase [Castellaniella defragrans 65Phen]
MSNDLAQLAGKDLGAHAAAYDANKAILYALAVGAAAAELDLVYERNLRVLPTFGCALGLWAVEAAGRLGAYDPKSSLHVAQKIRVHRPLPASGSIGMRGRVAHVYDKGKAALLEIEVESEFFTAAYTIFLPGLGGWGGDRGPSAAPAADLAFTQATEVATTPELAALYRLTGDLHPVHIDPEVARTNGFSRPILHGLCTLGISARVVARQHGAHPADLRSLEARLTSPVLPGEALTVESGRAAEGIHFRTLSNGMAVLSGGKAVFG